jgi:hypothetical protein
MEGADGQLSQWFGGFFYGVAGLEAFLKFKGLHQWHT